MGNLAHAGEVARRTFTKPGLADRAIHIQKEIEGGRMDGIAGIHELQKFLLEEGEYRFEQEVADFPVSVNVRDWPGYVDKKDLVKFEEWLSENLATNDYIAFPSSAQGKYKEEYTKVFFKDRSVATYFKVACM